MKIVFHCILTQNPFAQDVDAPVVSRFVQGLVKQMDNRSVQKQYYDPLKKDAQTTLAKALAAENILHILVPFGRGNQTHLFQFLAEHPKALSQNVLVVYKGSWGAMPQTMPCCDFYNIIQDEPQNPWHNQHWAKSAVTLPAVINKKIESQACPPVAVSAQGQQPN